MSKKTYNATTIVRSAKPRSKRLREAGYSSVTVIGGSAEGGTDVSHSHANKAVLDAMSLDTDRYLSATLYDKEADLSITEKIKAGYADQADQARHALNADDADKWDGNEFADYLDQSVRKGDKVRFEQVVTPAVTTPDFVPGGFAGAGAGLVTYANGQTGVEVDHVVARRTVSVNEVIINQAAHVGGRTLYSAANMECVRVVNGGTYYRCFFDTKNGQRANLWRVGDQAYCQRYSPDGAQLLSYYWRLVTSVGEDWINLSVTDCDGAGIPSEGDNIIQVGSRTDPRRQALLEIDQTNGGRVVQYAGINSFNFVNRNEVAFGVNDQGKPFFYAYGDLFVGDRDLSDADATYITFQTPEGETRRRMVVAADLRIGRGSTGLTNLSEWADKQQQIDTAGQTASDAQSTANQAQSTANETARATQAVNDYVQALESDVNAELVAVNKRLDGVIENYFELYDPTLTNYPANEWTTDKLKEDHNGDTFTNKSSGNSWKWKIIGGAWTWNEITDTFEKELLNKIAKAQATADGKMQSFVLQPTPPYSVGDSWSQGPTGDQMRCIRSRTSGVFDPADWDKASKYTDDTAVDNLQISDRNLLKKSAEGWKTNAYRTAVVNLGDYRPSEGEECTLVIKGALGVGKSFFGVYNSGGFVPIVNIEAHDFGDDGIAVKTFKWKINLPSSPEHNAVNDNIWIYAISSSVVVESSIEWVKLVVGNKTSRLWTAAPEDVQAEIDAAQSSAEKANNALADMANDLKFTPQEKAEQRDVYAQMALDYQSYQSNATTYGVSLAAVTGAYNNLRTYLADIAQINDEQTTTTITTAQGATYDQYRSAWKTSVDNFANSISKKFADDVQVGGVNLIPGTSKFEVHSGDQQFKFAAIILDEQVKGGDELSLHIENAELISGDSTVHTAILYNFDVTASFNATELPYGNNTWSFTIPYGVVKQSARLLLYSGPAGYTAGNNVRFTNVTLVRGNKPMLSWAPSVSETKADIDAVRLTANESRRKLTDWASDSIISPVEKTGLRQRRSDIISEYERIKVDAQRYKVATANYTAAYTAAILALDKYTSPSPAEIVVEDDYDNIAAYYYARELIEKSIDSAADVYFLKEGFEDFTTTIAGGLVLSSFMGVRNDEGDVMAGMAGRNFIDNKPFVLNDQTCPMIFAGNSGAVTNANSAKTRIYPSGLLYTKKLQAEGGIIGGFEIGESFLGASGADYSARISSAVIFLDKDGDDYKNSFNVFSYPSSISGGVNHTQVLVQVNRKTTDPDNYRNVGIQLSVEGKYSKDSISAPAESLCGNFALYIEKGKIAGSRYPLIVRTRNYNISTMDHYIVIGNTSPSINLYLPSDPEQGQTYWIVNDSPRMSYMYAQNGQHRVGPPNQPVSNYTNIGPGVIFTVYTGNNRWQVGWLNIK